MTGGSRGYSFPVRSPDPSPGVTHVLLVCHANQCRSPYAEALARQLVGDAPIEFASAGLIPGGSPMPTTGRMVGREFGLDFATHRSREIDLHDFGGFDLILTMARAQARELVAADPDAWPRIFTLKQFSRWIAQNPRPSGADVGAWLDATAGGRPRASLMGVSDADDVEDPLTLPATAWRAMVTELSASLDTALAGLRD